MAALEVPDAAVMKILNELRLVQFAQALRKIGVVAVEDFTVLDEQDFMEHVGMNLVEARKLSRKLGSIPPEPPPELREAAIALERDIEEGKQKAKAPPSPVQSMTLSGAAVAIQNEIANEKEQLAGRWESPAPTQTSPSRSGSRRNSAGRSSRSHSKLSPSKTMAPSGLYAFSPTSSFSQGAALSMRRPDHGSSIRRGYERHVSPTRRTARKSTPRTKTPSKGHDDRDGPAFPSDYGVELLPPSAGGEEETPTSVCSPKRNYEHLEQLTAELDEQLKLDESRANFEANIRAAEAAEDWSRASELQAMLDEMPTSVRQREEQRRFREAEAAAAAAEAAAAERQREADTAAAEEEERLAVAAAEADRLRQEAAAKEHEAEEAQKQKFQQQLQEAAAEAERLRWEAATKEAEVGLYHVTEKDHKLVPRGKRVFCQGKWGTVEKVRGGEAPWVEIRFDDNTKATNASLGSAFIRLDGRYGSPTVKIQQEKKRRRKKDAATPAPPATPPSTPADIPAEFDAFALYKGL